jgi:hypothetical protein
VTGFAASKAQRDKCRFATCAVCGGTPCDPAHLIPRSLLSIGQDDPRAVIALCRADHRAYDQGSLDLLPYLEPTYSTELAYAVNRFGLARTYRRVTNSRSLPEAA